MTGIVPLKSDHSPSAITSATVAATDLSAPTLALTSQAPTDEPNVFLAAQRGDINLIRQLIESGRARATDRDEQNITPLHWAAINAQLPTCRYLLEQGAEGRCPRIRKAITLYILVTHSSSIMPLLYLLHQPISVDERDSVGHTALMWAAYQGDALSVEILLKHGANPTMRDDSGLTPLHWAVVRGNKVCILKLIEKGAEIHAKDNEGRTARDMAVELKSIGAWKRALEEGGFTEDGPRLKKPLSERNTKLAVFFMPTLFLYMMFTTLTILPWYTGMILALAEFFGMHHIVTRVLLNRPTYTESVTASPYFAGIIFGSMVWVAFAWVTRLFQQAESYAFVHLIFALSFGLCAYNFFRAMILDPGTCPAPTSDAELKSIIEDLAAEGRLNGQTFCIQCMARKPLRSKHCRICGRCVARSDHHCPWVWNCVGLNNHRQFIIFVTALVIGIVLFDYLSWAYFSSLGDTPTPSLACFLPDSVCRLTATDMFLFSVAAWSSLQLVWTVVLLISQFLQISRQMTTLEVSNLGRYGFMGGRGGSLATQMSHRHTHALQADADDALSGDATPAGGHAHSHGRHRHVSGCSTGFLMQLLGFDRFTTGKAANGLARAGHAANPFNIGVVGNCRDFWTRGRELGVEYERLYEIPAEGLRDAKKRREREEAEEAGIGGRKGQGLRQKLLLGLGIGGPSARAARGGYEPVSQV
ncbi:palmitoyltransferase AKR1 [Russula earlei]|uniref:Palmitoyltransferase AKR1 n=1 Tax=Russula earlei TaxID=71964 RepID=A0ACC0U8A8_9AGAM|nr:palmitoyltransferase AKR1 [Russula earlei]